MLFGFKKVENNLFPVTSYHDRYQDLTPEDTDWKCINSYGFQTETHTYYSILTNGSVLMIQVIYSYLGVPLAPVTTQMTFKVWDPTRPEGHKKIWKSVNVTKFEHHGRSSQAGSGNGVDLNSFKIVHTGDPTSEEVYTIKANLGEVKIDCTFTKPASSPGWKYGDGYTNLGAQSADKRDAFVIHRFHGYALSAGSLELHGEKVDAAGTGMFVHAMQSGMQPNKIASRWNFTFFAGQDAELGSVTAIQMEFTTTDSYGPVVADNQSRRTKVNIGSIYATNAKNGRLTIVGQTHESTTAYPVPNKDVSVATHLSTEKDPETGYLAPHGFRVDWAGDRLDGEGRVVASAEIPDLWSGLIEKVDVLAEIPKILRRFVAAATGADPYIFQYHNPTTVNIEVDGKTAAVKGWMFNEASFISA